MWKLYFYNIFRIYDVQFKNKSQFIGFLRGQMQYLAQIISKDKKQFVRVQLIQQQQWWLQADYKQQLFNKNKMWRTLGSVSKADPTTIKTNSQFRPCVPREIKKQSNSIVFRKSHERSKTHVSQNNPKCLTSKKNNQTSQKGSMEGTVIMNRLFENPELQFVFQETQFNYPSSSYMNKTRKRQNFSLKKQNGFGEKQVSKKSSLEKSIIMEHILETQGEKAHPFDNSFLCIDLDQSFGENNTKSSIVPKTQKVQQKIKIKIIEAAEQYLKLMSNLEVEKQMLIKKWKNKNSKDFY